MSAKLHVVTVRRVKLDGRRAYYAQCEEPACGVRTSPIPDREQMTKFASAHRLPGGPGRARPSV